MKTCSCKYFLAKIALLYGLVVALAIGGYEVAILIGEIIKSSSSAKPGPISLGEIAQTVGNIVGAIISGVCGAGGAIIVFYWQERKRRQNEISAEEKRRLHISALQRGAFEELTNEMIFNVSSALYSASRCAANNEFRAAAEHIKANYFTKRISEIVINKDYALILRETSPVDILDFSRLQVKLRDILRESNVLSPNPKDNSLEELFGSPPESEWLVNGRFLSCAISVSLTLLEFIQQRSDLKLGTELAILYLKNSVGLFETTRLNIERQANP